MTWRAHLCLHNGEPLYRSDDPETPMTFDLFRVASQLIGLRGLTKDGKLRTVDHVKIVECRIEAREIVGAAV